MKRPKKATDCNVSRELLKQRVAYSEKLGYGKQKWVEFCETMLDNGLKCSLYEARRTVSKYITVRDTTGRRFKVRFSNHRPIKEREDANDCDFFVGIANKKTTTTAQAIVATLAFFKQEKTA